MFGLVLLAALPAGCASNGRTQDERAASPSDLLEALVYVRGVT